MYFKEYFTFTYCIIFYFRLNPSLSTLFKFHVLFVVIVILHVSVQCFGNIVSAHSYANEVSLNSKSKKVFFFDIAKSSTTYDGNLKWCFYQCQWHIDIPMVPMLTSKERRTNRLGVEKGDKQARLSFGRGVVINLMKVGLYDPPPQLTSKARPASSIQRANLHSHKLPPVSCPYKHPQPRSGLPLTTLSQNRTTIVPSTPSSLPAGDHSDVPPPRWTPRPGQQTSSLPPSEDRGSLWEVTVTHCDGSKWKSHVIVRGTASHVGCKADLQN